MADSSSQPVFILRTCRGLRGLCLPGSAGEVIYVGKARNLRSRMSSYFRPSGALRSDRRRALIHSIASYEIFPVATESEALLLEAQFIKQYKPRYNVELRDDKRFCWFASIRPSPFRACAWFRFGEMTTGYFGAYPQATTARGRAFLVSALSFAHLQGLDAES